MLTKEQIVKLSSRKGVKKTAVETFLETIDSNPNEFAAYGNMCVDAKLYKWKFATTQAITKGIRMHYNGSK